MTTVTTNGYKLDAGVYVSGSRGHYVSKHIVAIALELGWTGDDADEAGEAAAEYDEMCHDEGWQFFDCWYEIVDLAVDWLNEHTDDGMWMTSDGDFCLYAIAECGICGDHCWVDLDDTDCSDHMFVI